MILTNARILTLDDAMPTAAALAIAGGKVLGGVDSREDAIASHAHEQIDLQGAVVVPGFVDAHVHFVGWALSRMRLDLRGVGRGVDDASGALLAAIADHADTLPQADTNDAGGTAVADATTSWVLGRGWLDRDVRALTTPTAALDRAVAGRAAALESMDGHALWINGAALTRLGLDVADLGRDGGLVERDGDGAVLREHAAWSVRARLPRADLTTAAMAAAMREACRLGITTLHDVDGAVGMRAWSALDRERGLSLRVHQHLLAQELDHLEALGLAGGFGSDRLRLGGIKAFADGTLGSGTAWLHEPELVPDGESSRTATPLLNVDDIARLARRAGAAGCSLLVHAIGDAAGSAVVDALERTVEHWSHLPSRPRIEHAQLLRATDRERCARLGIALSVQPSHLAADRDLADARWGDARCADAFAFRSMLEAGCNVLFGSDAPIEPIAPLTAISMAVDRDVDAASGREAWHAEQAVPAIEALRASTVVPADVAGVGAEVGRLVPGRAADLVVLDGDPLRTPARDLSVVATMVGGRWTYGRANIERR